MNGLSCCDDELTRTTLYVVFIVFDPFTVQPKRKSPEPLSISQIFSDPSSRRIECSGKAFNQRGVKSFTGCRGRASANHSERLVNVEVVEPVFHYSCLFTYWSNLRGRY